MQLSSIQYIQYIIRTYAHCTVLCMPHLSTPEIVTLFWTIEPTIIQSKCYSNPQVLIFRCLSAGAYLQVLILRCLSSGAYFQVLILRCLSSGAYLQVLIFRYLSSGAYPQVLIFRCLSSVAYLQVLILRCLSSGVLTGTGVSNVVEPQLIFIKFQRSLKLKWIIQ